MGSSAKTTILNLNKWYPMDKPKRADFVNDNEIIDSVLGGHLNDTESHLTQADREYFESPVSVVTYAGNGDDSRTITVPSCSAVFVYKSGASPVEMVNGNLKINSCFAAFPHVGCPALAITSKTSINLVRYTSPDGAVTDLNTLNSNYVVLVIR